MALYIVAPTDHDIQHHGILGQKWGKRNGPPYPLGSDVSTGSRLKTSASKGKSSTGKNSSSQNSTYDAKGKHGVVAELALILGINLAPIAILSASAAAIQGHAKLKEKIEDNKRKKLPRDEKADLPLKKKETKPKEDLKHTNPGFNNGDDDTKNNCPFCCMAYDLRRRGYDVRAGKTEKGRTLDDISKFYKENKKFTVVKVEGKDAEHNPTPKDKANKMRSTLLEKSGEGTRGTVGVGWLLGGNHVMNYEVKDGKVHIYDAQSGQERNIDELNTRIRTGFAYLRTDNLTPDYKKMKKEGAIVG